MRAKRFFISDRGEPRAASLVLIAMAVGAAAWLEGCAILKREPTPEGDLLKFSHGEHAQYVGNCADCHFDPVEDDFGPATHESCVECHVAAAPETPPGNACLTCHHSTEPTRVWTRERPDYAQANFDHPTHEAVSCADCHGEVLEMKGPAAPIRFPRMEDCLSCHAPNIGEVASADCFTCHFALDSDVIPDSHRAADWGQVRHGMSSRQEPNLCARCHVQAADCEICHAMEPPGSHTPTFRNRTHGFSALNDPMNCQTCHTQAFCEACHLTTEPINHTASFKSGPSLHCATCHLPLEEGNRCSVCHQGDPHADVFATPPPPSLVALGLIDLSQPCLPCHPVNLVPITHPTNTVDGLQCIQCHKPLGAATVAEPEAARWAGRGLALDETRFYRPRAGPAGLHEH